MRGFLKALLLFLGAGILSFVLWRLYCTFLREREAVRALVEEYTWQRIASQIANCYADLATCLAAERAGPPELARTHPALLPERGTIAQPEHEHKQEQRA